MLHNLHNTTAYILLLAGFSLPISTAGVNTLFPLISIFTILLVQRQQLPLTLHPIALAALALWLWGLLAISYSLAGLYDAILHLKHYLEFLYLSILLLLFREVRWQRLGIHCFMMGTLVVLLGSYFVWFSGIPLLKATVDNPVLFKNYITQGILFCIAAVLLGWYWQQYPRWRSLTTALFVLLLYNVLFIGQGRTAYVIVFALLLWSGFRWQRWRGLGLAVLVVSLLLLAVYQFSDSSRQRLQQTFENISTYQIEQAAHTSVGYRLEFYYYSLQLIVQRPLLGVGTGGFAPTYAALTADKSVISTANPHNEYLMLAVQWGIPGILLFTIFVMLLIHYSKDLGEYKIPAQGLIIVMLVGCLFNSLWLDFTEGYTFAYFIGLFYASLGIKK